MNYLVLDCETLHSAEDCQWCVHHSGDHPLGAVAEHKPIGWENPSALGLSIGCYYDSSINGFTYFDAHTPNLTALFARIRRASLFVTFNGRKFDIPLLIGLVPNMVLAEEFQRVADTVPHYDILHEIWQADPANKFTRGNSLDAVASANGYGSKSGSGALAPVLWRQGRWAEVINYCQRDVDLTRMLFAQVCAGKPLARGNGLAPVTLPVPEGVCATPTA